MFPLLSGESNCQHILHQLSERVAIMKILLVDDESYKLRELIKLIKSIDGIGENDIKYVLDLNSARREVQSTLFNILILDLNMPEGLDATPKTIAGAEFLDEIIEVDSYYKPLQIVVLTEYSESEMQFGLLDRLSGFTLLKYDINNTNWSKVVTSKITYALKCEKRDNNILPVDVAIITAVSVETTAIKNMFANWEKHQFAGDPSYYFICKYQTDRGLLTILQVQQNEMGMTAAAALSTKVIARYNPKYLVMVGIAAGISGQGKLGDIIIPAEIWTYNSGKYIAGDSQNSNLQPDPKYLALELSIKELITQTNYDFVLTSIRNQYTHKKPDHAISIITNPIACGAAVVADPEIPKSMILAHSRKTAGLDMESYGIFYAAKNYNTERTIPICIKSICDFADDEKDDSYQEYAAYTSSAFAKHIIEYDLDY